MNPFAPVTFWTFWILLVAGWMMGELQTRGTIVFLLLMAAGLFGSRFVFGGALFIPYMAVLDIVLVLFIFKGDIKLH